ncbi:MAG: HAD-IIIA family hydrolase [Gemmatimonadetes bacterium]|nr:HAD-IIIA family hydrolase [Gemmatimonadota bacterium]
MCGGLGTRLRPLTSTIPKPMAPVNGRPFLSYLVQQLKDQGVRRVLLLTGYLGETIQQFFGDGTAFGVEITYSKGPTEWETGRRLCEAKAALDATFLLLYADNYAPFRLERLAEFHRLQSAAITLSVQPSERPNIRMTAAGRVDRYDASRTAPGLEFVEIGYMIVERDAVVGFLDVQDVSLSTALHRLAAAGNVFGLVSRDPYHSISDMDRLRLTERYLAPKRIVLMDRDGTINARPGRAEYVRRWADFRWLESTVEAMQRLAAHGFRFIVLSNQAGIARGAVEASAVAEINAHMCEALRERGVDVLATYVCPHHWDAGCECRKPAPGLFFQASQAHQIRLDRTIYIGDDPRDSQAAFNACCSSVLIGPDRHGADGRMDQPDRVAESMLEIEGWIIARYEAWESMP